jgi:hypothetical protein
VYLHKTSVAAEQLLIKILTRAKELADSGVELFCSPALRYFLYNHITAADFENSDEALRMYSLLDDSDVLSAIKTWISADDKVLSVLSDAFTNRRLLKGKLLSSRLTETELAQLKDDYSRRFSITQKEAEYFFVEHVSSSRTYSEKDEAIDILYNDGTVRDIAEVSEIFNLEALTRRPEKLYLFYYL